MFALCPDAGGEDANVCPLGIDQNSDVPARNCRTCAAMPAWNCGGTAPAAQ